MFFKKMQVLFWSFLKFLQPPEFSTIVDNFPVDLPNTLVLILLPFYIVITEQSEVSRGFLELGLAHCYFYKIRAGENVFIRFA